MEPWMTQVIVSLVGAVVTLAGVIAILQKNLKPNNPNGARKLNGEFTAQVKECGERFLEIAEDRGEVKASLKSIDNRLGNIEKGLLAK